MFGMRCKRDKAQPAVRGDKWLLDGGCNDRKDNGISYRLRRFIEPITQFEQSKSALSRDLKSSVRCESFDRNDLKYAARLENRKGIKLKDFYNKLIFTQL